MKRTAMLIAVLLAASAIGTCKAVKLVASELAASQTMLQQLQQQDSSISGVSLDQEASNLLLYQRVYQAAAQALSALDQLLQTAIQMGAGT